MNLKRFSSLLVFMIMLLPFTHWSQGNYYTIEKGVVKGDYTIKLVEQNIILTPNTFFSITELKLRTNKPFPKDLHSVGYKRKDLISYKITIERLSDHKLFYGRLAFYGMIDKPNIVSQAVASYYNIEIAQDYFAQARDGITSCVYEYYTRKKGEAVKFPTWAIWFSDVPVGDELKDNEPEISTSDDKENVMYKGRHTLGFGIGFVNLNALFLNKPISEDSRLSNSSVTFSQIQPLFFKYEFAVKRRFSIGLNFSFHKMSAEYSYSYQPDAYSPVKKNYQETIDFKAFSFSIKTSWHFAVGKHFEMYGGPGIGFNSKTVTNTTNARDYNGNLTSNQSELLFSKIINQETREVNPILDVSLGARLFITKTIGIYSELSAVKAALQIGLVAGF